MLLPISCLAIFLTVLVANTSGKLVIHLDTGDGVGRNRPASLRTDKFVDEIMENSMKYYLEFKKFTDDLAREENEDKRFAKFKRHLAKSAASAATLLSTVPAEKPGHSSGGLAAPALMENPNIHQKPPRALKDVVFETFYDNY